MLEAEGRERIVFGVLGICVSNEILGCARPNENVRTVPPRNEMPSSRSSSSIPDMPTTYTFLSFGKLTTVERYTAAAYADPKISSYPVLTSVMARA